MSLQSVAQFVVPALYDFTTKLSTPPDKHPLFPNNHLWSAKLLSACVPERLHTFGLFPAQPQIMQEFMQYTKRSADSRTIPDLSAS